MLSLPLSLLALVAQILAAPMPTPANPLLGVIKAATISTKGDSLIIGADVVSKVSVVITAQPTATINTVSNTRIIAPSWPTAKRHPLTVPGRACFPYGAQIVNETVPSASLKQWWCPAERQYGFLGFSYPLENSDCSDASNSYDQINADFQLMKKNYGARMVRIYAPQCRKSSIWRNLLQAGIDNNMAVIPLIWWGFQQDQNEYLKAISSLKTVLDDSPMAPYVFHSIEFGSEPVGDWIGGSTAAFTSMFKDFKSSVEQYGIPITISEDWDRPGRLTVSQNGDLNDDGQTLMDSIDMIHAHTMPYYHGSQNKDGGSSWPYIEKQLEWFAQSSISQGKQVMITETMWASSSEGSHGRGVSGYKYSVQDQENYWNLFTSNCATFKKYKTGWFVHVLSDNSGEASFGILDYNNNPKFDFSPQDC